MAQDEDSRDDREKAETPAAPVVPKPKRKSAPKARPKAAPRPKAAAKPRPKPRPSTRPKAAPKVVAELPLEPPVLDEQSGPQPPKPAPDDEVRYLNVEAEDPETEPEPVAVAEPVVEAAPAEDAAHAHSASEEVTLTRPREAPLPDDTGLATAFSPVDLPEPEEELKRPFAWTTTVIGVASLLLALFNAEAIRGWANELPAGPISARIVEASDQWYGFTDRLGLTAPTATMRGWWDAAQAARFGSTPPAREAGNEAAPDGTAP